MFPPATRRLFHEDRLRRVPCCSHRPTEPRPAHDLRGVLPLRVMIMCHPLLRRPLRFATYLAPNVRPVYEFIARYVGDRLGCTTELIVGDSYARVAQADVAFLCGLPYVRLVDRPEPPIELLAAPVLRGARYGGRPVYFSD